MKRLLLIFGAVAAFGCSAGQWGADRVVHPVARGVSAPVPVNSVQDAAFWVHPTDPAKGLLLITNEQRGLEVHAPDGTLLKHVQDGIKPQYVDVLYDFPLNGKATDLALVTCTGEGFEGVKIWAIDKVKGKIGDDLTAGKAIKVLGGDVPLGLSAYRSPKNGKTYVFITDHVGKIEQNELVAQPDGLMTLKSIRTLDLKAETKGIAADSDHGVLYALDVKKGVWRFDADPEGTADWAATGNLVIKAGEHHLTPGLKGPAIYRAANGRGYLLVVSQASKTGQSVVNVYDRQFEPGGENKYVLTIDPAPAGVGPINHSSGLDVTNCSMGPAFPLGVLAVNDQQTNHDSEDFKLYAWDEIARAGGLMVEPGCSPRLGR